MTEKEVKTAEDRVQELQALIMQYRMKYIPDHPNRKEFDEHFGLTVGGVKNEQTIQKEKNP